MLMGMLLAAVIICGQIFGNTSPAQLIEALRNIDPSLVNPETSNPYGSGKGSAILILPPSRPNPPPHKAPFVGGKGGDRAPGFCP